jgi:hypothetical protein
VNQLLKNNVVVVDQDMVALVGFADSFKQRHTREKTAQKKWSEVDLFLSKIQHVPWIKAVFVTGALAVNNASPNDDVDFMIVTAPQRLWLTRIVVSVIAFLSGKRRTWNGFEPNSWCFNLWLTSDSLGCFAERQSLYTAYELQQMKCVYDKDGIVDKLWHQNTWIQDFLPSFLPASVPVTKNPTSDQAAHPLLGILDRIVFSLQQWYMYPHQTREVVTLSQAFFHPRDTQAMVFVGWINVLKLFSDRVAAT